MYQIITRGMLAYLLIPPLLILLGFLAVDWPESLWSKISLTGTTTVVLVLVLGSGWGLWRFLWRWWPKLNIWVYPDLNGVWQGTLKSNWPVIERLTKAAKGEVPAYDPFGTGEAEATDLLEVSMTIRIRADWFRIRVALDDTGYSDSSDLTVMPLRGADGTPHALTYIYKNRTADPKATDTEHHLGAAWLEVRWGNEPRLDGKVWTERRWRQGVNTAGRLCLTRVSSDPDADVPGRQSAG